VAALWQMAANTCYGASVVVCPCVLTIVHHVFSDCFLRQKTAFSALENAVFNQEEPLVSSFFVQLIRFSSDQFGYIRTLLPLITLLPQQATHWFSMK